VFLFAGNMAISPTASSSLEGNSDKYSSLLLDIEVKTHFISPRFLARFELWNFEIENRPE
jgi:hypothetical protein